jgi:hypothetical protein
MQFFLISWNLPYSGWDIIKYKIVLKILNNNKINRNFLMIFGGSSVTAGYSNYYNHSYPIVLEKRMSSIFSSLDINLIIRNIAQKQVHCRLANLCYETMGGENADFIGIILCISYLL